MISQSTPLFKGTAKTKIKAKDNQQRKILKISSFVMNLHSKKGKQKKVKKMEENRIMEIIFR